MGVDVHSLALLAHASDLGARFERTLGIGRQAVFVADHELQRLRSLRGLAALPAPAPVSASASASTVSPFYFEPLLQAWFAAATVDSVDASAYEQATFVHDMNLPWPSPPPFGSSYDAVLDFGCLEHVFDFPTAWRNCVAACRVGGHLLHALPANNLCGHGFYQFSPELFFNLYRAERGFELCGIWLAMKADPRHWWRVAEPRVVKRRVTLQNSHEVTMLVLAKKAREVDLIAAPQQSDYAEAAWLASADGSASSSSTSTRSTSTSTSTSISIPPQPLRSRLTAALASLGALDALRAVRERRRAIAGSALSLPEPDYRRVDVDRLLGQGTHR